MFYPALLKRPKAYDSYEWKTKETEKVKNDLKYFPNVDSDLKGFHSFYKTLKGFFPHHSKLFYLDHIKHWNMRAFHKAPIHPDFDLASDGSVNSGSSLVPVILSHGAHSNRRLNYNTASELAANGCIVYCINHTDGSSLSYANPNDAKDFISYDESLEKPTTVKEQLKIRVSELEETLKFMII